jgi:pSer/pThr/pTyr-binding forkhead associated (FHA) protein
VSPSLLIAEGSRAGERIEVAAELVLGREGADVIIEDGELSRRHARVRPSDGAVEVEDLDSLNGTWVNGVRISAPTMLGPGDLLRLGSTTLEVEAEPPRLAETIYEPQPLGETVVADLTATVLESSQRQPPPGPGPRPAEPARRAAPDGATAASDFEDRDRRDRLTFRVAGAAAVAGTVLGIPAQLLHPLPEADVATSFLEEVTSASSYWTAIHLMALLSLMFAFVVLFGVYRLVAGEMARLFAGAAVVFGAVGTAFVYSWFTVDGAAIKNIAEDWERAAPDQRDTAFRVANAVEDIILGYFSMVWVFFFGIPFILAGAAVAASTSRRITWLGLWGVVAGSAALVAGLTQLFTGRDFVVTDIVIPITAFAVSAWVLVTGIVCWRRASELARARPA